MALCSEHRHVLSIACTALFTQSPTKLSEAGVTLDAAEEQMHRRADSLCHTANQQWRLPFRSRFTWLENQCSEATSKTLEGGKALTTAARDNDADTTSNR